MALVNISILCLFPLLSLVSGGIPCENVFIGYCNEDIVELIDYSHCPLEDCRQKCSDLGSECDFSRYHHRYEECYLYKGSLAEYNQQCRLLGAPKNVSELCDINMENPNEAFSGCSGFRESTLGTFGGGEWSGEINGLKNWSQCQQACNNNPECGYWIWDLEDALGLGESTCRLEMFSKPGCYDTISPGGHSLEECQVP